MGYFVRTLGINFRIKPENLAKAYDVMCKLNFDNSLKRAGSFSHNRDQNGTEPNPYIWFSWMEWNYHELCSDAEEIFNMLGFETEMETAPGLEGLYLTNYDNKSGQEDVFLNAVSHLVEPGGFIDWLGEDGDKRTDHYGDEGETTEAPRQEIKTLYVTFGMQYAHEEHPTFSLAHPDGWVRFDGDSADQIHKYVFSVLGPHFAFFYTEDDFFNNPISGIPPREMYIRGEIARFTVPEMTKKN